MGPSFQGQSRSQYRERISEREGMNPTSALSNYGGLVIFRCVAWKEGRYSSRWLCRFRREPLLCYFRPNGGCIPITTSMLTAMVQKGRRTSSREAWCVTARWVLRENTAVTAVV